MVITPMSAAAAWPLAVRAQQAAMALVGILSGQSPEAYEPFLVPFRQGLNETGFVEGTALDHCPVETGDAGPQFNSTTVELICPVRNVGLDVGRNADVRNCVVRSMEGGGCPSDALPVSGRLDRLDTLFGRSDRVPYFQIARREGGVSSKNSLSPPGSTNK
jgi:hypothetical protein